MRQLLLFLLLVTVIQTTWAATQPNIIIIVADDLGFADTGFRGSTQIPTPNLDTLAYDGVILNNYHVQPICTPSRAALMTGRYPIHTGMQHEVIGGATPYGLGLNETLLSQIMKEVNYSTHIVGKWHLGFFAKEYTPIFRGFETHFGFYLGKEDYWDHSYVPGMVDTDRDQWGLDFYDQVAVRRDLFGNYSTYLFRDRAQKIIREHDKSKPLFLMTTFNAVHVANSYNPLEAPYEYVKRMSHIADPNRRKFAAMLSALDDAIGNITVTLHEEGLLNNSVIIFTTDNGGPAGGYDLNYACNWPLRGMKYLLWEGGTRGAAFVWSPLLKKSGYVTNEMMHITDWLPTLSSLAGYPIKSLPAKLDGHNIWKTISENQTSPRSEILLNIDPVSGSEAVRKGDYKLVFGENESGSWGRWFMPSGVAVERNRTRQRSVEHLGTIGEGNVPENNAGVNEAEAVQVKASHKEIEYNEYYAMKHEEHKAPGPQSQSQSLSTELVQILKELGRDVPTIHPVTETCKAAKYVDCDSSKAPCLFNIKEDPCELQNLANQEPEILKELQDLLEKYRKSMVPIRNKPKDKRGFPIYRGGVWGPWINLTQENWHIYS